jgi:hypothetical protein
VLGAPTSPRAGQSWNATISAKLDGKLVAGETPALRILNAAGRAITFATRATARTGIYRATVVFPRAGSWRVIVLDRQTGRAYEFGKVRVLTA